MLSLVEKDAILMPPIERHNMRDGINIRDRRQGVIIHNI